MPSKMCKKAAKYIPLEPLGESPDSSWGEAAQLKLLESEREGKGYKQIPKVSDAESELMNPNEPT